MMKDTLKLLSVHWGPTVLQSWLPTSSFTVEAPGPRVTVCENTAINVIMALIQ